jgi:G3E family GTPase
MTGPAIPLAVLTGYLGSGKTTLLGRLLKSPRFARTAVIINEFGEIPLDHDLIETSKESSFVLPTGCLCCQVRGDLVNTLADILRRRQEGAVQPFERVVIETSGLADPAPILHALMSDASLCQQLLLAGVVTTVDAVNGPATLARQPEAVKQVAVADRVVLTKMDLIDGGARSLLARLAAINPSARLLTAAFGEVDAERLFDLGLPASLAKPRGLEGWLGSAAGGFPPRQDSGHDQAHPHARRHAGVSSFAMLREQPIRAVTLTLLLEALAEHCGGDLLRLKGIVNVAENPGRPAVVHGVQHLFHPPTWLDRWPSEDRRSRIVFIVRGIPRAFIEALLSALELEVGEVIDSELGSGQGIGDGHEYEDDRCAPDGDGRRPGQARGQAPR